jgi:hypothetical protein
LVDATAISRVMPSVMEFFLAAAVLLVLAGLVWLSTGPRLGDLNRAGLAVFFGHRLTRRSGWFATDDRGVYVTQRGLAWILLTAAAACVWIGLLKLLIG